MGKKILFGLLIVIGLFTLMEYLSPGHYDAFMTYINAIGTNFGSAWR